MRILMGLLLGAVLLPAQQQAPHGDQQAEMSAASLYIGDQAAIDAGHELYLTVCSGCHGATGEGGRGPNLITGRNVRRASDQELFTVIKNGIPGSDMPPSPLPDDKVWQIAAYVRNMSAPAYQQAVAGDAEAGKELFFGAANCSRCHMVLGEGGYIGPDLSNVGLSMNMTTLREAVLEPNVRFAEGFRPVVVKKGGEEIRGVAKNNSNYSLQMIDFDGRLHLLDKRNLKEVHFPEKSWMPDDYSERLSEEQLQSLFAYLSRLAVRPPSEGSSE